MSGVSRTAGAATPRVRLSVQVVTWNSAAVIDDCLASVAQQDRPDVEAIVVDNASRDGSASLSRAWLERGLRGAVIEETSNRGFCGGQNRALARSGGDLILFLNPDATLAPGFAARAIEVADSHPAEVGIFAPRLLLPDGRIDSTGLTVDRFRRGWDRGTGEAAEGRYATEEEVFGATGACALLRRAMLDDVTLDGRVLDERLFAYVDDVDLAWRARLRGWRCLYVPSLVAGHGRAGRNALRADAREPRRVFEQTLMVRNRLLVIAKCEPLGALLLALPRLAAFEAARVAFLALRVPRVLRAYPQALALLPAVLRDRHRVQRRRRAAATAAPVRVAGVRSAA